MVMAGRTLSDVPANVGVINTVVNRLDKIRAPDIIIVDEAHRSVSPSYLRVFEAWPDAIVIGLTATPERTDGKGLGQIYNDIVTAPPMRWLIDNGILSDYEIIAPASTLSLEGVDIRAGDYATDQLEAAVDKPTITGDAVQAYIDHANGERCMVFCVTIEHSQHVAESYRARGIPAEHVDGNHTDAERDGIFTRLRSGETLVVTSVQLAIEGLDVPAISVVQFLRPTASLIVYLQAIGRGLRVEPGKTRALILDQVGNWTRHGLPDDEREWRLEGRKTRKKRGENDAPDLSIKQCRKCFSVFRAGPPACPKCGEPVPGGGRVAPETVAGDLVKIDPAMVRREQRREQGGARSIEDLVRLGVRRGMQRPAEWAATVAAARQGRRPTPAEYARAREALNG
jgi:superfamily II DNA or RNA helicase